MAEESELTIDYNFGDCELRAISFSNFDASLIFFDPSKSIYIYVDAYDVDLVLFQSDHMQNVVESVNVFKTMKQASDNELFIKFLSTKANVGDVSRRMADESLHIMYIQPIAGSECVILCKNIVLTRGLA